MEFRAWIVEHRRGRRTDSPGERDWHSWGVSEGSCWAERDTIRRVHSRYQERKRAPVSMSASEGVAVLGLEGAPKGGGKPGVAMVGAQGREV